MQPGLSFITILLKMSGAMFFVVLFWAFFHGGTVSATTMPMVVASMLLNYILCPQWINLVLLPVAFDPSPYNAYMQLCLA